MSKVRLSITMETKTLAKVRAQVRARKAPSVSAYIARAVDRQLEDESLADLVKEMVRQHGEPSREAKAWARKVLGA